MSETLPLKSVHWVAGMLLTPEQLLHQDLYTDAAAGWALRYLVDTAGLVGGGVRAARAAERIADHDPAVDVEDDGEHVHVTVSSARGVTPSGRVVEIAPADARRERFAGDTLAWANELLLALVHSGEKEEDPASTGGDEVEPELPLRRVRYEVRLPAAADEVEHALVLARLRRDAGSRRFVLDDAFLPPCATVCAHSRMHRAWRELHTVLDQQGAAAALLHSEAARYLAVLRGSGLSSPFDEEVLACVERLALAVDACARDTLDPALPPHRLFAAVGRLDRQAALALGLVAFRHELLQLVPEAAPERGVFAAGARNAPAAWREPHARPDLAEAVEEARASLGRLSRLLSGIGERYRDYRVCRVLPSLRYILDPEVGEVWERRAETLAAGHGDEARAFAFAGLALSPGAYRLVLTADPDEVDGRSTAPPPSLTLLVNPVPGEPVHPQVRNLVATVEGQRNFATAFEVPDGAPLSALRVEMRGGDRFPRALLYRVWDGHGRGVAEVAVPWGHAASESESEHSGGESAARRRQTIIKASVLGHGTSITRD